MLIPAFIREPDQLVSVLQCVNSLQVFASRQVQIEFLVGDDCSPYIDLRTVMSPCSVIVQRNEQNLGFSGNINALAARARGDILLLCNQDILAFEASAGWDVALMEAFNEPGVGIVGAKLLDINGRIQSVGGEFDGRTQPFHRCLGYERHWLEETNTPREVSWTTGAALAIRSDLFRQAGGLDTAYVKGYWEDVDLNCKVRELGYKVWYEPRMTFIHKVGSTGGNPEYFHKNAMLWKSRWVETKKVKPDTLAVKEGFW